MCDKTKASIRALYTERPITDRERVANCKEEIIAALSHEVTIGQLLEAMQKNGFQGGRKKFTNILVELGIHKIRVGHKKDVTQPVNTPPSASEGSSSCNYTIGPNGTKIWGGKKNNNLPPTPAIKPVEDTKIKEKRPPGSITQEELEKEFGKKGFW